MKNVLFLRDPSDTLKDKFNDQLNNINSIYTVDNLSNIEDIECIVGWRPDLELLRKAKNLKLFINPGTGVQHLIGNISEYFIKNNITLVNGHGNSYFTAEHAVAMYHTLTNRIIPHHQWMLDGKWRRGDNYAKTDPIRHKTIGLLGYGAINQKVHRFLSGYDVKFHALKRRWDKEYEGIDKYYTSDNLHPFIDGIDVLIIAIPLTSETENIISSKELELLDGYLINVGRGGIIDQQSLYDALKNNVIKGAAIDVWYEYQPEEVDGRKYPYNFPFHELDNILLSPHRAASPFDDIERWDEVIINLNKLANDDSDYINQVDLKLGY